jgi:hypothetical protein
MRKSCKSCGHGCFWHWSDSRFKCRRCGVRQSLLSVWDSCRSSEACKCKLLECFVFGVPVYRLRFRGPASLEAIERFFLLVRGCKKSVPRCSKAAWSVMRRYLAAEQ